MSKTNAVTIVRVYDHEATSPQGAYRVLVDRLWPRGIKKETLDYDDWCKDVTPSPELRKWYGHDQDRFAEFAARYTDELTREPAASAFAHIQGELAQRPVVLLTAVKQVEISAAAVLFDALTAEK